MSLYAYAISTIISQAGPLIFNFIHYTFIISLDDHDADDGPCVGSPALVHGNGGWYNH